MSDTPTVALGYCHTGIVHHAFMRSINLFMLHDLANRRAVFSTNSSGTLLATSSAYIPEARNMLVKAFLDEGSQEWLWFLDYDIEFVPETLYKLLDAADPIERPIIGGLYFNPGREGRIVPIFYERDTNDFYRPVPTFTVGAIQEVDTTGMGCTLIHRSVFEEMRKHNPAPWHWYGHEQGNGVVYGEDITFCRRAQKLGYKIYGHAGVLVNHIKSFGIGTKALVDQAEQGVNERALADMDGELVVRPEAFK